MNDNVDAAPGGRWRMSLRGLFASVACFAVGLSCSGGNWAGTFIGTAAAALIYGMLEESAAIRRSANASGFENQRWPVFVYMGIFWRLVIAAAAAGGLAFDLLLSHGLFKEADSWIWDNELVDYGYLSAIVLGYSLSWRKWRVIRETGRPLFQLARWAIAAVLLVYVVGNKFEIVHLVHRAVESVERSHPIKYQRHWAYPNHASEHYRFFWTATLAALCVCVSSFALIALCRRSATGKWSAWLLLATLAGCQLYLLAYLRWFYLTELRHVTPDIAEAGLASTAADWRQAAALFAVGAIALACVLAVRPQAPLRVPSSQLPLHETTPMLVLLVAGGVLAFVQQIRAMLDVLGQFGSGISLATKSRWMIEPYMVLHMAIVIVALCLLARRWKHVGALPLLTVPQISGRRFLEALVGLLLIVATGIPALSAFGFAFWFAPWLR